MKFLGHDQKILESLTKIGKNLSERIFYRLIENPLYNLRVWIFVIVTLIVIFVYPIFTIIGTKKIDKLGMGTKYECNAYFTDVVPIDGKIKVINRDREFIIKLHKNNNIRNIVVMSDSSLKLIYNNILDLFRLFINDQIEVGLSVERTTDGTNLTNVTGEKDKAFHSNSTNHEDKKVKITILAMPEKFFSILKNYGALILILLIGLAIEPIFKYT